MVKWKYHLLGEYVYGGISEDAAVMLVTVGFNPLYAKLNPIRHLLVLLGAHHILHVSRVRVNLFNLEH